MKGIKRRKKAKEREKKTCIVLELIPMIKRRERRIEMKKARE